MVPLYIDPVRVARINDEIPQYHESKRANIACKKAIENSERIASDGFSRVPFSTFRGMAGSDTITSFGRTGF